MTGREGKSEIVNVTANGVANGWRDACGKKKKKNRKGESVRYEDKKR